MITSMHFNLQSNEILQKTKQIPKECTIRVLQLTISGHTNGDTLLQAAILTTISVNPKNGALLVLCTWPILNFLLDGTPEKSLPKKLHNVLFP